MIKFIPKPYRRSIRERRLIRKNPWGDKDRDGVPNWIDCKPFNRFKQGSMNSGRVSYINPKERKIAKQMLARQSPDELIASKEVDERLEEAFRKQKLRRSLSRKSAQELIDY